MALTVAARRAIAIRNSIKRRQAANDNADRAAGKAASAMHPRLLAMCVEAGGFDQNARFA